MNVARNGNDADFSQKDMHNEALYFKTIYVNKLLCSVAAVAFQFIIILKVVWTIHRPSWFSI